MRPPVFVRDELERVPVERDRVVLPLRPREAVLRPDVPVLRPDVLVFRRDVLVLRPDVLRPEVLRLRVPVDRDRVVPPLRPRAAVLRPDVPVLRPAVLALRRDVLVLRPAVPVLRRDVLALRPDVPVLRAEVLRLRVPVERDRAPLDFELPLFVREPLERDPPRDELLLREPDRLVPRPRDDAERARLVPTVFRLCELPPPDAPPSPSSSDSDDSPSSSSPPSPSSFFATPTAAGTATPRAAPATTFWVVDMPSSSLSPFSL